MPKPTKGARLGGGAAHERLILANLASALFINKSIKTTEARAKRLRPVAERLVTFAKRGDLASRRRALAVLRNKAATPASSRSASARVTTRPWVSSSSFSSL
jgi:large subunit ribosomal protein L17